MSKRKKTFLWFMGVVGTFLVLVPAFLLVLSSLINLEPVKKKVLSSISEKVGGEVKFQRVELSFFPFPHVVIHQASLSIPGKVSGTLESLSAYLRILPLLKGKLHIAELQIERPDFEMDLPEIRTKKTERIKPAAPSPDVEKKVARFLAPLAVYAPDLIVEIKDGRLNFSEECQPVFSFKDINAQIVFPPEVFTIHLACASNLWEKIEVKGALNSEHFTGKGRIDLIHFRPHILTSYVLPDASQRLADSQVNLSCRFNINGFNAFQVELEGSLPHLTFQRGNEEVFIKGNSLKATLQMDAEKTAVSLTELNLDYPRINMTGNFVMDKTPPRFSVQLEGREVDVHSTRETALALAGDAPTVQDIFDVLRDGKVPLVTFKTQGNSLDDLGEMENMLIKGHLLEGKVSIPGIDLRLEDVKGDAIISQGTLNGENLEARVENSRGHGGKLELGLKEGDHTFHLDIPLKADLSRLLPVLNGFIKDKTFLREINLIEDLKGSATGRLVLGETTELVNVNVDVSELSLSAKYRRIPYPLEISGGNLSYDETGVKVKNLKGKLGKSFFSGLSGRVNWKRTPHFEIKTGKSEIFIEEIYTWLTSLGKFPGHTEDIKAIKGVLTVSATNLKGPLLRPEKWHFEAMGELRDFKLNSTLFPGPVVVTRASYHAIEDATQQKLSLSDAQISILDASLVVSGVLRDYLKGFSNAEIALEGGMGLKSTRWVLQQLHLPPEIAIPSLLTISQGHVIWDKGGETSFKGNLAIQNGPKISINILQNPQELMIRNLLIQDEKSHASLSLNLKKKEFSLKFIGNITEATMAKLFLENQLLKGWIKGDFQVHILPDQPMRSTAQGKFMGQGIILPLKLKIPLKIESVFLGAEKNRVKVESTRFTWGDIHMAVEGDVNFSEAGVLLDVDLSTGGLDWSDIQKMLEGDKKEKDVKKAKESWDLPLQGTLKLKSEYLKYDKYTWRPFYADITFTRNLINVAVTDAGLCGISTPGVVEVTPQGLSLNFQPVAKDQELNTAIGCLWRKEVRATGNFDLKAEIKARGKGEELVNSIEGNLEFAARDGRVHRHVPMEKLLAYLNVLGIIKGELSEMRKEGFAYKTITAKAKLQNGKLALEEGIVDGLSMDMAANGTFDLVDKKVDLKVLACPIKTLDSFIKKIPVIKQITGGHLISVAVKVKGDLMDPDFTPLPPSAVGDGLVGMMKRIVAFPFKIIESIHPKDKEKEVTTKD